MKKNAFLIKTLFPYFGLDWNSLTKLICISCSNVAISGQGQGLGSSYYRVILGSQELHDVRCLKSVSLAVLVVVSVRVRVRDRDRLS